MAEHPPEQPLVSVITATYDMAGLLGETMDAVLGQDYRNIEYIVVDDGSRDNTAEVVASRAGDPRVRYVHQENAGQTRAKNRGIEESTGEYIAFCDADDVWLPHKLSTQIPRFLVEDPPGLVYADTVFFDEHGNDLPTPHCERFGGRILGKLLIDNFIPFPTTVVSRTVIDDLGPFDERRSMAIDYEMWLRISTRYWIDYVPEVLARYRIWSGQMSHRRAERLDNAFKIMIEFQEKHADAIDPIDLRKAWGYAFTTRAKFHNRHDRPRDASVDFLRAFARWPFSRRTWWEFAAFAFGPRPRVD